MMDYPRVPITEWNLGKFPHAMEFQSWKLNFRTEVCMRPAESQVTLLWIKEFVSYSIDELVTSRSITGQHNFLATRSQSSERELVSKSNELKIPTDSYEEDKNAYLIYEYFRATGAYETAQGLSDLFAMSLHSDDVQDFDVRWYYQ